MCRRAEVAGEARTALGVTPLVPPFLLVLVGVPPLLNTPARAPGTPAPAEAPPPPAGDGRETCRVPPARPRNTGRRGIPPTAGGDPGRACPVAAPARAAAGPGARRE